jgi:hypothetical protein
MTEFEKKFHSFIANCPDCKILDDRIKKPKGLQLADFLLNGERVVAELKCLEKDMLAKLQEFATELIKSRNLSVYGAVPFEKIIEQQPDRVSLKRTAFSKIGGDRLQTDFRNANRQIRDTKNHFGLQNSHGLLIVANTGNYPLTPDLAYWFLSVLLRKRKQDGSPLCSAIDCILYLSELHDVGRLERCDLKPGMVIQRDERADYGPLTGYIGNGLLRDWADFSGLRFFKLTSDLAKPRIIPRHPCGESFP